LGIFRLVIDGVVVDTASSRRIRHLLAYLLTHRRAPVARDVLMDVFWPDATPAAARNNLHVALSGVRQVLRTAGPHIVVERRFGSYRIAGSAAVWTDVEQFESVREAGIRAVSRGNHQAARQSYEIACQLYEGDFLADEPYLEWATPIRETLLAQRGNRGHRMGGFLLMHSKRVGAR
jgi:DNA-binding SARP family transcriptional activator